MLKLENVIQKVKLYNPRADGDLIKKAYVFSAKAHEGQLRRSGQPFVTHPLEVANILADMKLDVPSVVAGFLHDTIEDTHSTKAEIASLFGEDISSLVDGVTKLSKIQFNTREERQAENFRKMILAMSKDIRVILIKLADRLHNLKTLQFMPEEKQMRIAQETLDIYAPLANRLGIQWMKVQLEDLSFRFLKPNLYRQLEKKIARLKKNREEYIARVEKEVRRHFKEAIPDFEISGRMKHIHGIYQKMERQNITFEQVHDLLAFRILTHTLESCYEALGLLHSIWKPVPGRFKDYLAMPKTNNYQSLHTTVVCLDAERVEFQIRTVEMHEIAEKGIAAHWKYKEGGPIDLKDERTIRWLRQFADWQKEVTDDIEYLDTVKLDLFATDIYVFTPKGDVRALPYGATPVDFAYSIHSDIGQRCVGARVNGRMVPLSAKLDSGDEVEIITHKHGHPSKDWLKLAVSSRARSKIRQFIKQDQRDKSMVLGKNLFEQECAKAGLNPAEVKEGDVFKKYLEKKGINSENLFYSNVAYGKLSLPTLFAALSPATVQKKEDEGIIRKIFKKVSQRNRNAVLVDGLEDLLITFAKCCLPIPGDPIVGFVSRGRGVTLHRTDCSRVSSIDPGRRVTTAWNVNGELIRTARLKITCEDRAGMLAHITHAISEKKINITRALVRTTKDNKAIIFLDVSVSHIAELHGVIKEVEKINGVIGVERQVG